MNILTVSQLNRYIKSVLEEDKKLADIYIKGEISNFVHHFRSGHFYFTLKDENASIRAVMFKSFASDLKFEPENGMAVLIRANLGVYERDGAYQLYVTDIQPDGAGALAVAFEQLKRKLMDKGLFDERFKKPIPEFPARIGVVSSQTGAALQDIINVITRRYPICTLVVAPAQVQGKGASATIIKSLKALDEKARCDVIILARGGGSAEDLWAFNDEALAYAVFEAITPIVSAVGHEVDYTICDFVADLRAPTPSAAAELVAAPVSVISARLAGLRENIVSHAFSQLDKHGEKLMDLRQNPALNSPMGYVLKNQQRLDFFAQLLYNKKQSDFTRFGEAVASRAALLDSLSPLKVLSRGYCAAFRGDKALLSASDLNAGDEIELCFHDGRSKVLVQGTEYEKKS